MKTTRTDKILGILILSLFILGGYLEGIPDTPQKSPVPAQEVLYSSTPIYTSFPEYRTIEPVKKKKPVKKETAKIKTSRGGSQARYLGTFTISHYCSCKICCGANATGTTASGKKVREGMVAASRNIPFGTKLKIDGVVYSVEDRLATKYDSRIDVFVNSHSEAIKLGVKREKVWEVIER